LEKRDVRDILTFSWLDEVEVLEYFIRDFCKWELIHEISVKNSGVKSVMREVLEGQDPESLVLFLQEGE